MHNITQYIHRTDDLGKCVNGISRHLTSHSDNLNELTTRLESLFDLFSRGNELLKIMQQYSSSLQQDINNVKRVHSSYRQTVEHIAQHMGSVQDHLKSITRLLTELQNNAGAFVSSAQTLGHLAKNTEIRAYHAQKEGKGLGIIAKECLTLAKQAQLPFHDFHTVLKNLQGIAEPVIQELQTVLELSQWSHHLFDTSLTTLGTIDTATATLNTIVSRIEESSKLSRELQDNIDKGLDTLKKQMVLSLTTIDDLSIRCSHIRSHARILETLSSITDKMMPEHKFDPVVITRVQEQYKHYLEESIRASSQFTSTKKIPTFSQEIYKSIQSMHEQITVLDSSAQDLIAYRDNVGSGMTEVISLAQQITNFLDKAQTMNEHLNGLGNDLQTEVLDIEELIRSTTKIFNQMKTLTTFARIEEGRSEAHRAIIKPIVQNFVDLETETERAFSRFAPMLSDLRKDIQFLRSHYVIARPETLKYPDYSKIRLFLDDLVRVFADEHQQIKNIVTATEELFQNNFLLENDWNTFQAVTSTIHDITRTFATYKTEYHAPATTRKRTRVVMCLSSDPITFLPDRKTDITSHQVICNMSCGLFQFGEGVDVIPALCEDYTISEDGLEYTITMRDAIKYHTGKPIRIEAVKEAFFNALNGPNFGLFDMIDGAKDFIATKDRKALGVQILNNRKISIRLEYPYLPFLANCATNIADPYIAETIPHTTGPFRLIEYEPGSHIIFAANEHYHEGRPPVDELHYAIIEDETARYPAFKQGTIDVFQPTGESLNVLLREQPHVLMTLPELSIQYFVMNCQLEPFNRVEVRKAICHALDVQTMVNRFSPKNAIPAKGLYPPSINVFNPGVQNYRYDPPRARELMTRSGYKNGLPDVYTLDVRDSASVIQRAEFVKASLTDIGIRVNINPMPWKELLAKQYSGDSLLSFGGWIGDNGDPDNFVYPLFHSSSQGQSGNTFFFSSSDLDGLMDRARKTRNVEQRNQLYRQMEQQIIDKAPCVFLYHRLQNIAVRKEITGFKPHPLGFWRAHHVCSSRTVHSGKSNQRENDRRPVHLVS